MVSCTSDCHLVFLEKKRDLKYEIHENSFCLHCNRDEHHSEYRLKLVVNFLEHTSHLPFFPVKSG